MTASCPLVLITGAARRIGRVLAEDLLGQGWNIALHYNTAAQEAADLAQQAKDRIFPLQADLREPAATEQLISRAAILAGQPVVAIVNNAALFVPDDHPSAKDQMRVNAEAPRQLTALLARSLLPSQRGRVVHLLDGTPTPDRFSLYAASKKALAQSVQDDAERFASALDIKGLFVGPALINPRESAAHFAELDETTPPDLPRSPQQVAEAVAAFLRIS